MCDLNHEIAGQDSDHWNLSQICSLAVSKFATKKSKGQNDLKQFLSAAEYGRLGLNCSLIYDECGLNEQRFIKYAQLEAWSPVGELKHVRNLVSWIWTKI